MIARSAGKTGWEWTDLAAIYDFEISGNAMPHTTQFQAKAPWVRPGRYADRLKRNRAAEGYERSTWARKATPCAGCPWLRMARLGAKALPAFRLAG